MLREILDEEKLIRNQFCVAAKQWPCPRYCHHVWKIQQTINCITTNQSICVTDDSI